MKKAHRIQILFVVVLFFLLWLFTSCKTKYIPVESVKTEYKDKYIRDSIFQKEYINSYQKGDTIFIDRYIYKYKDRFVKDTVKIDSLVQVPYPVKGDTIEVNKLKWYQEACIWFTSIVLVVLVLYSGIKYRSKIFSFFRKMIFKV